MPSRTTTTRPAATPPRVRPSPSTQRAARAGCPSCSTTTTTRTTTLTSSATRPRGGRQQEDPGGGRYHGGRHARRHCGRRPGLGRDRGGRHARRHRERRPGGERDALQRRRVVAASQINVYRTRTATRFLQDRLGLEERRVRVVPQHTDATACASARTSSSAEEGGGQGSRSGGPHGRILTFSNSRYFVKSRFGGVHAYTENFC